MASNYIVTAVSVAEQHTDAPTESNAKPKTDACPEHPPFAGAYPCPQREPNASS
jgi:hypothetical protein